MTIYRYPWYYPVQTREVCMGPQGRRGCSGAHRQRVAHDRVLLVVLRGTPGWVQLERCGPSRQRFCCISSASLRLAGRSVTAHPSAWGFASVHWNSC